MIYLDNHATTAVDPRVLEAMLPALKENYGNPASNHLFGVNASYLVEKSRHTIARSIGALDQEIIFTSGATESNNLTIKGLFESTNHERPHFIVCAIEHKCILESIKHIQKLGAEVTIMQVNSEGIVDLELLKKAIQPNTVLVSIMFANNEIGSINPIKEIGQLCHRRKILFHSDAAQVVGKIPINVTELNLDILSASGHKFYGPKGVGFIYIKKNAQHLFKPLLSGGGQEYNLRSGTSNVPGIVGIAKALELSITELASDFWHYLELRNHLFDRLMNKLPDLILNGPKIESMLALKKFDDFSKVVESIKRLPNNLNIILPNSSKDRLNSVLKTVAFSSSSACSSNAPEPSYVLTTIGRNDDQAKLALRFGIGRFNTLKEIDITADLLIDSFN